MDSFELNKIAGAVLGTLVLTMGLGFASQVIVSAKKPEKPGYVINVPEEKTETAAAAPAAAAEPIAKRLASADPAKGQSAAKACQSCHNLQKGGGNGQGPALWGVVERQQGAHPGFTYSATLADFSAKGGKWTYENLDQFIENPKGYAAGTKMSYAGIKDPKARADVIAYLRSLADTPAPLPAP
ncbi:MAG: cytochrome c family protein [Beijerinckiaceae bacterium]|nr:cytochrome c family protein [Beijerinckiaceae bacterium]